MGRCAQVRPGWSFHSDGVGGMNRGASTFGYAIIRGMEKVATDIYLFRELRENGFSNADKTAMFMPLCDYV